VAVVEGEGAGLKLLLGETARRFPRALADSWPAVVAVGVDVVEERRDLGEGERRGVSEWSQRVR
jgi:hypothetical protein